MNSATLLETGIAALLFAVTFLVGGHVHPLRAVIHDRRNVISFCAGMTVAYVFVHLLPELHDARQAFAESASVSLRYEGKAIYFLALIGFLVFYGLDHMRAQLRKSTDPESEQRNFRLHVGSYAAYAGLMSYLLVRNLEGGTTESVTLYAAAVVVHFLTIDHALREEHGNAYQQVGRFALAGTCLAGWGLGVAVALPQPVLALLVAFVSGSVVMISLISELPAEKDGRFVPFLFGGLLYGAVLLPLS